jgi:antitoxin (DNA-binding transcriptional repressor) of toxin-antitoxin stability system
MVTGWAELVATAADGVEITVTYEGKTDKTTIDVEEADEPVKTVESIVIKYFPATVTVGAEFPSDGEITVTYSDQSTDDIAITASMVTRWAELVATAAEGVEITVTYEGKTDKTTIDVEEADEPVKTVESIVIKYFPATVTVGAEFPSDGEITVTYSDQSTDDIAITASMVTGWAELVATAADGVEITVTYEGKTDKTTIDVEEADEPGGEE